MSKVRHHLVRITVTVPPDLVRFADQLARRQDLSRSAVLSEALRRHVSAVRPAQVPASSRAIKPGLPDGASPESAPAAPQAAGPVPPVARVAEPAVAPYQVGASTDLAFATDAELVAELQRRLTEPGRRLSAAQILDVDRAKLAELCRRHHIAKLSLFGSVLGDDFRPDSDLDVLVEFEPGQTPGFGIIRIQDEVSALFGGRRVDLVTQRGLNRHLREPILASAQVFYEA